MSLQEQKEQDEQVFNYGDDIKVSRNAHDALPVPLNGRNVPTSMNDPDWQTRDVVETQAIDSSVYGAEYLKVEQQRIVLTQIKKDLATLHKYVVTYQNTHTDTAKQDRDRMINTLNNETQQFNDSTWYTQYTNTINVAQQDTIDADRLIQFAHDDIKRLSALIFNHNQRLMQELKKIKQEYNKKQSSA